MADQTGIQWCDATFNPWVGCEKVSPGCAHCYAETLVTGRMARNGTWGVDGTRQRTSPSNWKKPLRWARLARDGRLPNGEPNSDGHRPRVFCASLADVFEERAELVGWRVELFDLIALTPEIDWLILTKRPEHARRWLPDYYVEARDSGSPYENVWLGVSIENARHTWRADILREIPAAVRFISAEPLLGSLYPETQPRVPVRPETAAAFARIAERSRVAPLDLSGIDWVIVGGESGPGARPFQLEHAREIIRAAACPGCLGDPDVDEDVRQAGRVPVPAFGAGWSTPRRVTASTPLQGTNTCGDCGGTGHRPAVFVKQLGAKPRGIAFDAERTLRLAHPKGGDPSEWPADLLIREFPTTTKEASAA